MQRYFLEIAFNGSNYVGWQIQPDVKTVQGEINTALTTLFGHNVMVAGCGRTDAGVHASQFYLHFDTDVAPHDNIVYKLNSILGAAILVRDIFLVNPDEHSRYSAEKRTYQYFLHTTKTPFLGGLSYQPIYRDLDFIAMNALAAALLNVKDFKALSKLNENKESSLCDIYTSQLKQISPNRWVYEISANRFLWNMVRRIVGALISVGRGKLTANEILLAIKNGEALPLNFVAPPHGLYLAHVEYSFIDNELTHPNI